MLVGLFCSLNLETDSFYLSTLTRPKSETYLGFFEFYFQLIDSLVGVSRLVVQLQL
jgi:hypothetical protein